MIPANRTMGLVYVLLYLIVCNITYCASNKQFHTMNMIYRIILHIGCDVGTLRSKQNGRNFADDILN